MGIRIVDEAPAVREYIQLIESTGWQGMIEKGEQRLAKALETSWYAVSVNDGDQIVGMGRIISDGVLQALICDVIVLPAYQGHGIGKLMMHRLLATCEDHAIVMVHLFAAQDKASYYHQFGFEARSPNAPGMRWTGLIRGGTDGYGKKETDNDA